MENSIGNDADLAEGGTRQGEDSPDPDFGDTQTGGMGVDVAALGGGAAISGDALGDGGQAGPDIDGGSR